MAQQLMGWLTTILRRKQVEGVSGYSRSTIYLRISQGLWTKPVALGARAVGWPAREVEALNAARISGKCDAEIRALVTKLEAERADRVSSAAGMEGHEGQMRAGYCASGPPLTQAKAAAGTA